MGVVDVCTTAGEFACIWMWLLGYTDSVVGVVIDNALSNLQEVVTISWFVGDE